jgi:hypothetical protein
VFAIDKNSSRVLVHQSAVVRIAHVVPHSAGYTLGPVVMTFPAFAWADSAPTWIYGGGDLWLYEWDNPGGVDLERISATTGDVLQRLRVPKVWHPILAYNDDGLWVAPSGQSGSSELYLVAPGATTAARVFHFPDHGFAKWIVGSDDALWLNAQPRAVSDVGVAWMLRGPEAKPVGHVPESASLVQVFETLGDSGMVGVASDGLWAAPPTAYDEQQVVRIDPMSGALSIEATWKAGYPGSAKYAKYLYMSPITSWTGVTLAGSFFLLARRSTVSAAPNPLGASVLCTGLLRRAEQVCTRGRVPTAVLGAPSAVIVPFGWTSRRAEVGPAQMLASMSK